MLRRRLLFVLFAVIAVACDRKEPSPNEAAARVYADEAVRSSDRGERDVESADAMELVRLHRARAGLGAEITRQEGVVAKAADAGKSAVDAQKRILDEDKQKLSDAEAKIGLQRMKVEANVAKLTKLKKETEAILAQKSIDAGMSRFVLEERLAGVKKSLVDSQAALVSDGGD